MSDQNSRIEDTGIRPLGDRVLVKKQQAASSKGGILLPESAQERPRMGVVVAKGPGERDKSGVVAAPEVEVGQNVLFSSYAGTEVPGHEDLLLVQGKEILAVFVN